jgi:dienelactone hydrolase
MSDTTTILPCCLKTFQWGGTPTGRIGKLANNDAYIAGNNPDVSILLIHDLLSWNFVNSRLLVDHYAKEANATVYMPDFFGGETWPEEPILKGRFEEIDLAGFAARNSRDIREPEIFECARALRRQYSKVGASGFCYGGWAVFRLGAREHNPPLVDAISTGHPTWLTKDDIDNVAVPVQILAPELDAAFPPEMKSYAFETILKKGVMFDYQHYPGVEHACFTRGDEEVKGEREAMEHGKAAAVAWFIRFLH